MSIPLNILTSVTGPKQHATKTPCLFLVKRKLRPLPKSYYESPQRDLHHTEEEVERHVEEAHRRGRGKAEPPVKKWSIHLYSLAFTFSPLQLKLDAYQT